MREEELIRRGFQLEVALFKIIFRASELQSFTMSVAAMVDTEIDFLRHTLHIASADDL